MTISPDSEAVIKTIDVQQQIIARMSNSSSGVKNWCVTLTTALVALSVEKDNATVIWIAMIPIVLFLALDIYYLSLEKRARCRYDDFTNKVRIGSTQLSDLYNVHPGRPTFSDTLSAARSISIWPFYVLLILCLSAVMAILCLKSIGT